MLNQLNKKYHTILMSHSLQQYSTNTHLVELSRDFQATVQYVSDWLPHRLTPSTLAKPCQASISISIIIHYPFT